MLEQAVQLMLISTLNAYGEDASMNSLEMLSESNHPMDRFHTYSSRFNPASPLSTIAPLMDGGGSLDSPLCKLTAINTRISYSSRLAFPAFIVSLTKPFRRIVLLVSAA